ncbi:chrysanthemyl diphosphate synthase [Tanacetum coccineum]
MVLGIAPVAIIDRQLPFEYTITSRSTDVVVNFKDNSKIQHVNELLQSLILFEKQAGVEWVDMIPNFPCFANKMRKTIEYVRNYNMHNMGKTVGELHAMLIEYEKGLPKKAETPQVMMIKGGKIQKANKKSLKAKGKGKANGKGKDKQVYILKPKNHKPSAKEHPAKDDTCHHCKEVGHWKRNCLVYLAELLKKKKQVGSASSSGIFTIELFSFPNKSWEYDTGCGTNICITKQGIREARKLKQGALYLYVGTGVRAQVEATGSYDLVLPNGLVICLENYQYAPSILREFIVCNGIYEIDMHNLVPNVNSIYNVSTKRAKHNLDSTYLWHCRLAHISKKRIEKLQHEGLLKSTDDESFDQCVSCSVRCTRLDVAFAQNITSRFQQNPGELHWTTVENILKYLRNTKDMFLAYGGNLEAELRAHWTRRSPSKYYVQCLLQNTEYISASEAVMEDVWIRKFISGLGIVPTINEPIRMFCDNSAALHFANEPGVQRGARHYHRRYHYVRESIALGEIRFLKVHTDDNLADPFTKALSKGKLTQHARSMGLRLASSFM